MEPLLACEDLRVDVGGVPACDGLGLRTNGERVLVLGAPTALFTACTGLSSLARGTLSVRGKNAREAVSERTIAGVDARMPLPPTWKLLEYVTWSARLAGLSKDDARASASAAVTQLELDAMRETALSKLAAHARRATLVAAAIATSATAIALLDPLSDLPEEHARVFGAILVRALADRAWIVFAPSMPLTSPVAAAADEAIVVRSSRVDLQGVPTELAAARRLFTLRVAGPPEQAAAKLGERGARVEQRGTELLVDLGDHLSTSELFAIFAAENVAIVELLPLGRALA